MKPKRYWLRGGMAGLLFGFALIVFAPIITPLFPHGEIPLDVMVFAPFNYVPFAFLIEFMLIGIVLGWLYGKIKSKN
jgi:hypothetical protein